MLLQIHCARESKQSEEQPVLNLRIQALICDHRALWYEWWYVSQIHIFTEVCVGIGLACIVVGNSCHLWPLVLGVTGITHGRQVWTCSS